MSVMFKIGNTDLSNRVVAEGYSISNNAQYVVRTDANHVDHKKLIRSRYEGRFTLMFKTLAEYTAFETLLETVKQNDGSYIVTVCDNKTDTTASIYAFLDYTAERRKNGANQDIIDPFEVTLTER